jgi:hypothetical protein
MGCKATGVGNIPSTTLRVVPLPLRGRRVGVSSPERGGGPPKAVEGVFPPLYPSRHP